MTIHYSVEERGRYLYLLGEGVEDGLEKNIEIHKMIVNACKERNCRRVLIDDRNVIYTASVTSIYMLVKYYAEFDVPPFIERAAVIANPKYKEDNQFFENTARNRGTNVRVFHEFNEAETWLIA